MTQPSSRRQPSAGEPRRRAHGSKTQVRHLALPERAIGPIAGTGFLLFVWAGVAHASGSGWVQTMGAVVASLLLFGLVAPAFSAPGLTVVCMSSPTDAVAGNPVELEVVGNRSMRCTPRSVGGSPVLLTRRIPARLTVIPRRRGVVSKVTVRLASAAPFGLLWWSRDQVIELTRPLHVAPQARDHSSARRDLNSTEEGDRPPRPALSGDLRGVRPYQHGDGRRRVHWGASAHTGDLMVRESEERTNDPIRIVAELPRELDIADRLAEEAMGEVLAQLSTGRTVMLETTEEGGRVIAPVPDRVAAGRRLARAVATSDGR